MNQEIAKHSECKKCKEVKPLKEHGSIKICFDCYIELKEESSFHREIAD